MRGAGVGGDIDGLSIHASFIDEFCYFIALFIHYQGDNGAGFAGARSTSRAVHIRLVLGRRIDVVNQGYVVHVDATGGNIGGNQYGYAAIGESLQSGAASVLSLIAVQTHSGNASASKLFRLSVHAVL